MAFSAANRSAALFQLRRFEECLQVRAVSQILFFHHFSQRFEFVRTQDTELALEAGYADFGGAAHKLLVRQCKCNLELGRIAHAQKSFDAAVDAIDRSGISKDLRQGLATELQVQIEDRVSVAKTFLNTFCVKVLHVGKFHTKFCRRPSSTWPGKAAPSTPGETRRPRWRARRRGGSSRLGQRLRKTTRRSRGHRHQWSWHTTPLVADTSSPQSIV